MNQYNLDGIIVGVLAFLIIGLFHPILIKSEYYFGTRIWPAFAVAGVAVLIVSGFVQNFSFRSILAFTGCTLLWCIVELFEQRKRVEKGWYPQNPKRKKSSG